MPHFFHEILLPDICVPKFPFKIEHPFFKPCQDCLPPSNTIEVTITHNNDVRYQIGDVREACASFHFVGRHGGGKHCW